MARVELKRVRQPAAAYKVNTVKQVKAALIDVIALRWKLAEQPTPDAAEQYGYCDAAIDELLEQYSALTTGVSHVVARPGLQES